MRKSIWTALSAAVGIFIAAVAMLLVPSSASAAVPNCIPAGTPYPVGTQAEIAVSTNNPAPGGTFEASGAKYKPNEAVKLYLTGKLDTACNPHSYHGGIFVGTAHTDATGSFDPPVTVPAGVTGDALLIGIGASEASYDFAYTTIHVQSSETSPTGTGTGPTTPAMTGVDVALLVGAGAVLIGAGVVFTRGGRRKASHS